MLAKQNFQPSGIAAIGQVVVRDLTGLLFQHCGSLVWQTRTGYLLHASPRFSSNILYAAREVKYAIQWQRLVQRHRQAGVA